MREALEAPVNGSYGEQRFHPLDVEAAGGRKVFCGSVYAACFNHLPPGYVEDFVRSLPWGHGSGVLVIDYEHDEDGLRVLRFGRTQETE
jgi:hypothetical protein